MLDFGICGGGLVMVKEHNLSKAKDDSFYLSEVLYGLKSKQDWNLFEIKLVLMLLGELRQHRVFINKDEQVQDLEDSYIDERVKQIPGDFYFTRQQFQNMTGVTDDHVAREIKKTCESVLSKIVDTPNPLDPNNRNSFKMFTWFNQAEYLEGKGEIHLEVNRETIKRLVVFTKYTNIHFQYIIPIRNKHSLYMYLMCKIMQSRNETQTQITLTIQELKTKLGLLGQYHNMTLFRKRVLEVVNEELNSKTDLEFSYTLQKTKNRYSHIHITVSNRQALPSSTRNNKPEHNNEQAYTGEKQATETSAKMQARSKSQKIRTLELQLRSYGVNARKAESLVQAYGEEAVEQGVSQLLEEIDKGKHIENIGGYLVALIEGGEGKKISSADISRQQSEQKQEKARENEQVIQRWQSIDDFCARHCEFLNRLLSHYSQGQALVDDEDIAFYSQLEKMLDNPGRAIEVPAPLNGMTFEQDGRSYSLSLQALCRIMQALTIAESDDDKLAVYRDKLAAYKKRRDEAAESEQSAIDQEIMDLKLKIADLITQ